MSAPQIITLGCRLNTFESEAMRGAARSAGLEDAVIVNTCAVTVEAERQARQAIRRARRDNPGKRIIVTGCAAQVSPETFAAMPEVDRVLGNPEKLAPDALAAEETIRVGDVEEAPRTGFPVVEGFEGRARAFVQVQQGCDHRCTYCIVPLARGPGRGIPPGQAVAQAQRLVDAGHGEVVLTGVDVSSYGEGMTLGGLAAMILAGVPELKRLRLTSLDPAVVDDALFRLLADEPRFMPHLHLSIQALDDVILKRMKRRHDRARVYAFVARARAARPDVVLGADLIAGFPTEDEAMFANTLRGVKELGLTYLHVFPFSPRPGTPAERMPQVAPDVRKARAARLRAIGDEARGRYFESLNGRTVEILAESPHTGHTPHFAPVDLDFDANPGQLVEARIRGTDNDRLFAEKAP